MQRLGMAFAGVVMVVCGLQSQDVTALIGEQAVGLKMRPASLTMTSVSSAECDDEDVDSLYSDSPLPGTPLDRSLAELSLSTVSGLDTPALCEMDCDWFAKLPGDLWDSPSPLAFITLVAFNLKLPLDFAAESKFLLGLFSLDDGVAIQSHGFVWANEDTDLHRVFCKKVLIGMLLHYKKFFYPGLQFAVLAYDPTLISLLQPSKESWSGKAIVSCHAYMLKERHYSLVESIAPIDPSKRATFEECYAFFAREVELASKRATNMASNLSLGEVTVELKERIQWLSRIAFFADAEAVLAAAQL